MENEPAEIPPGGLEPGAASVRLLAQSADSLVTEADASYPHAAGW